MIYYDLRCRNELKPRARYFFRCFITDSGLPLVEKSPDGKLEPGSIVIVYGGPFDEHLYRDLAWKEGALIHIHSSGNGTVITDSFSHRGNDIPVFGSISEVNQEDFPSVLNSKKKKLLIGQAKENGDPAIIIAMDIIMASFRLLSRMEEREPKRTDTYGRFPPEESDAWKHHYLGLPVVNIYFEMLLRAVRGVSLLLERPLPRLMKWPGGEQFAAFMSHDVDVVKKWTFKRILWEAFVSLRQIISGDFETFRNNISSYREWRKTGKEPYWNFDELIKLEKNEKILSTYFFCAYGKMAENRRFSEDPSYHASAETLDHIIRKLARENFEVALHGTGNSFVNRRELTEKKRTLEHHLEGIVRGVRHHYLRYEVDKTLPVASKAELMYDSTLGYAEYAGFRCSYAGPFFPFDWSSGEILSIVELPLCAMDTLFELHYDSPPENLEEEIFKVLELTARWGGLFSFLLHNSSLDDYDFPGRRKFYVRLIGKIRELGGRFFTGAEAAGWFLRRAAIQCISHTYEFGTDHFVYRSPNDIDEITLLIEKPPGWFVRRQQYRGAESRFEEKPQSLFIHLTNVKKDVPFYIDIQWDREKKSG